MGGSSSVINPLGKNFLGSGGTPLNRPLSAFGTGGISEFAQKNPFGLPVNNPIASVFGNGSGSSGNPNIAGPFSLDPNQVAADTSNINALGQQQYNQTLKGIDENTGAQADAAAKFFKQSLPDIAENAQAAHLYDSSGYGQEVARQQAALANQVASQAAQQKMQAIQGVQGFQTGALQRGQSLEDFINQANVAKTIGAQMAPIPASGKQNFGTVAQGVGALAPIGRLATGK